MGGVSVAQLANIDGKTGATLSYANLSDTATHLLGSIGMYLVDGIETVTVTSSLSSLDDLASINNATNAAIVLTNMTSNLTGDSSLFAEAFTGVISTYTGSATLTDGGGVAASTLTTINQYVSGHITDGNVTSISGSIVGVEAVTNSIAATGSDKFSLGTMRGDVSDINISLTDVNANASD
jgi:hypothetical protein